MIFQEIVLLFALKDIIMTKLRINVKLVTIDVLLAMGQIGISVSNAIQIIT